MPQALNSRFRAAEQARTKYVYTVEYGTPYEDVLKPSYWAHLTDRLRICDVIEVRPDDMSYFAELLVMKVDRTWAQVAEIRKVNLTEAVKAEAPKADEFRVDFAGPHELHRVIRVSDGRVVQSGISKKTEAYAYIENLRKTLAA